MRPVKGIIKVVDEMAVHDGPGLRSLVFLKGCTLKCKWCQNPELLDFRPEIWFHKLLCKKCGQCKEVCPAHAIDLDSDEKRINKAKCIGIECFKCVKVCLNNAIQVVGYEITAEDLYKHIAKYKFFYEHSNSGGVTLTGGEPLHQAEFAAEVINRCKENGIHTAIETSLYASYETLWKVVNCCDLIMCDIKHMDIKKHREGTGAPNELVLENLMRLNHDYKNEIVIRIPLIPGFNNDEDNIVQTLEFLRPLERVKGVDLLPFNVFPVAKYEALSHDWDYLGVERQSDECLDKLKGIVESYERFRCTIGGLW